MFLKLYLDMFRFFNFFCETVKQRLFYAGFTEQNISKCFVWMFMVE